MKKMIGERYASKLKQLDKELVGTVLNCSSTVQVKCLVCKTIASFTTIHSALRYKCNHCRKMLQSKSSLKNLSNYSDELVDSICQEYIGGSSAISLAEKYLYNKDKYSIITSILKNRNITLRDCSRRCQKFKINENIFDVIDTQEKAYMLGFLYADGGNVRSAIFLALHQQDDDILHKFSEILGTDKPIRHYRNNNVNAKNLYGRLVISNKKLVNRLSELGIVERKTFKIRFPCWLNDEILIRSFIRGYYDGDGSLVVTTTKNKASLTITSNENFVNDLELIIERCVKINCLNCPVYGKKKTDPRIKRLTISGNKQILSFLDWLYEGSTIHLTRKYDKFIKLKSNPICRK